MFKNETIFQAESNQLLSLLFSRFIYISPFSLLSTAPVWEGVRVNGARLRPLILYG